MFSRLRDSPIHRETGLEEVRGGSFPPGPQGLISMSWYQWPAAAVIPAPIAYMNVVAVKKPVVGFEDFVRDSAPKHFGVEDYWVAVRQGSETCGNVHRQCMRVNALHALALKAESSALHTP